MTPGRIRKKLCSRCEIIVRGKRYVKTDTGYLCLDCVYELKYGRMRCVNLHSGCELKSNSFYSYGDYDNEADKRRQRSHQYYLSRKAKRTNAKRGITRA